MKTSVVVSLMLALTLPGALQAAQNAVIRLHCLSLRFQPATAKSLGISYTFVLGTGPGQSGDANGELTPLSNNAPTTHGARFQFQSEVYPQPLAGTFFLDVPPPSD